MNRCSLIPTAGPILMSLALSFLIVLASCEYSEKRLLESPDDPARLRAMQSRAYDTADEQMVLRTVIATLQDLGFIIDDGNSVLGIISATKLDGYAMRMTISIRKQGDSRIVVRATAQYQYRIVTEQETYQQFFIALSKAMFLEAHDVE